MPLWRTTSANTNAKSEMAQNDPAASASQAAGTEWLSGHLHHLTEEQEGRLKEFKELCTKEGYYTPASAEGSAGEGEGEGEKKASHGDETML